MDARIVMMLHDALWVEAPMHEETEVERLVKKMMATAAKTQGSAGGGHQKSTYNPFVDVQLGVPFLLGIRH